MPKEIERKFLLKPSIKDALLNQKWLGSIKITQGYLVTGYVEVRIRLKGLKYFLTVKKGEGLIRDEEEFEVTTDVGLALMKLADSLVTKTRFWAPEGWEIDVYEDINLVVAEFEMQSPTQELVIPSYLEPFIVEEVTGNRHYSNAFIAEHPRWNYYAAGLLRNSGN
jgi:adenylate cyclase